MRIHKVPVEKITKLKNPLIEEARNLSKSKYRIQDKKLLLFGIQQIEWALQSNLKVPHIFLSDKEDVNAYIHLNIPIFQLSEGLMKKVTNTNYLIPCVGITHYYSNEKKNEFTIVFNGVQDHGNIGTIIRTGNAYGIKNYLTTSKEFDPFFPKVIDASRGTVLQSNFKWFQDADKTIDYLKKEGYHIIATSPRGSTLQPLLNVNNKPIALVFGNETTGITNEFIEKADSLIQIPMSTSVESLNVGVAAGISIYEIKMKEIMAMLKEKIQNSIGRNINITLTSINNLYNKKIKEISPFTANQIILLMALNCTKNMHINEINEQFGLMQHSMSDFLSPLLNNNLILNSEDYLSITENGKDTLAKLWPLHDQVENTASWVLQKMKKNNFYNFCLESNKI
ncbi:RNA methyltransferase [Bacillus bombysepticus]